MDPLTIAIAAVTILTTKFTEKLGEQLGSSAIEAAQKIRARISEHFKNQTEGLDEIHRLTPETPPQVASGIATDLIAGAVKADKDLANDLQPWIAQAYDVDPSLRAQVAMAYDHAKQVNIAGDNFGSISM